MKIWKRDTNLININKKMNNTLASHLGITITNIDNNILILFNNDQTINLKVKGWSCILEDIGKPKWPATAPTHLKNEKI